MSPEDATPLTCANAANIAHSHSQPGIASNPRQRPPAADGTWCYLACDFGVEDQVQIQLQHPCSPQRGDNSYIAVQVFNAASLLYEDPQTGFGMSNFTTQCQLLFAAFEPVM